MYVDFWSITVSASPAKSMKQRLTRILGDFVFRLPRKLIISQVKGTHRARKKMRLG